MRKKVFSVLITIFIAVCLVGSATIVFAENESEESLSEEVSSRNIKDFPKLIAIDENGEIETGADLVPAAFTTLGIVDETKVFLNEQEIALNVSREVPQNSTLRITNLGTYEGKEIQAKLSFGTRDRLSSVEVFFNINNLWFTFYRSTTSIVNPTQPVTIEYIFSDGTPVPESLVLGSTWGHSQNIHFEVSQSSLQGIVMPTLDVDNYVIQSQVSNYLIEVIDNVSALTLLTSSIPTDYIFGIHSNPSGSTTGVIMTTFVRRTSSVLPDNNSPSPEINGEIEEEEFKSKYTITQEVGSITNGNYRMAVNYDTKYHKTMSLVSIEDNEGNDLTSITEVTDEGGTVAIQIPKEEMLSLRSNSFKLKLEGEIDKTYSGLADHLNEDYLELPITASTNYAPNEVTDKASTWARPWGEAIPQEVIQGSSTADVEASDFVRNLANKLTDDAPFVVGFAAEKNFDTIGETSVDVVIESKISGIQNTITVPVTVVESKPLLKVEFRNELDQLLPGYTIIIDSYQVGDEIDLTKEQQVIDQLENLERAGYEIMERPENETAVKLDSIEVTVQYKLQGVLSLASAPNSLDFGSLTYNASTQRVEDPTIDQPLIITDTRADAADGWNLTASLSAPMKNSEGKELINALRYVYQGEETILNASAQTVYLNGAGTAGSYNVSNSWGNQTGTDGVKLQINSSDIVHTGNYVGVITWKIMAGQP